MVQKEFYYRGKSTEELGNPVLRPLKAGLTINKISNFGIKMMRIKDALEDMKKNKENDDRYPE